MKLSLLTYIFSWFVKTPYHLKVKEQIYEHNSDWAELKSIPEHISFKFLCHKSARFQVVVVLVVRDFEEGDVRVPA